MSKRSGKQQAQHVRKRVEEPHWSETTSGLLAHAQKLTEQHQHTDLVVIGVRKDGKVDILPYGNDQYRLIGIIRWTLDRISKGPGNG